MVRFPIVKRSLLLLLACSLGGALIVLAGIILFAIRIRSRTPADFLPADTVRIFLVGEALSSFVPDLPPSAPPPGVAPLVRGAATHVLLSSGGEERWITLSRLRPGWSTHRQAKVLVSTLSSHVSLVGVYLVWGEQDFRNLLLPSDSQGTLAHDPKYLATIDSLPESPDALLYARRSGSAFSLRTPAFLTGILGDAEQVGITVAAQGEEFVLSLSLPMDSPSPSSPSFSFLPAFMEHAPFPLVFGAEGTDLIGEFDALVTLLAEGDAERALILRGAVEAERIEILGEKPEVKGPYTFLVRQGSGEALEWLLAFQDDGGLMNMLSSLEPVLIRERTLPSGSVLRDVLADPKRQKTLPERYRGFELRTTDQGFSFAHRDSLLLLSNAQAFLREVLDRARLPPAYRQGRGGQASPAVTNVLHADQRAFDRLKLLLGDSPFFSSLQSFLGKHGSVTWYRAPAGTQVRHLFLLKP